MNNGEDAMVALMGTMLICQISILCGLKLA